MVCSIYLGILSSFSSLFKLLRSYLCSLLLLTAALREETLLSHVVFYHFISLLVCKDQAVSFNEVLFFFFNSQIMKEKQHRESFAALQLSLACHRVNMQTQSITDVVSNTNTLKQKSRCAGVQTRFPLGASETEFRPHFCPLASIVSNHVRHSSQVSFQQLWNVASVILNPLIIFSKSS